MIYYVLNNNPIIIVHTVNRDYKNLWLNTRKSKFDIIGVIFKVARYFKRKLKFKN